MSDLNSEMLRIKDRIKQYQEMKNQIKNNLKEMGVEEVPNYKNKLEEILNEINNFISIQEENPESLELVFLTKKIVIGIKNLLKNLDEFKVKGYIFYDSF